MARGTELAVEAGLADFAEQIFVGIAPHIHRLRFVHQAVDLVQRIHYFGQQQRRGQLENGVVHILGVSAVLISVEIFDERKHPLLHDGVHFPCWEVMKYTPFELLAVDGALTHLHLIGEDAGIRQSQHGGLFRPEMVRIIQVVNEHQISNLLDDVQRVHQTTRRKNIPKTVNFIFQFACNHESNPLKVLQFLLIRGSYLHLIPCSDLPF